MGRKGRRMLGLEKKGDVLCRVCGDKVRDQQFFFVIYHPFYIFLFCILGTNYQDRGIILCMFFKGEWKSLWSPVLWRLLWIFCLASFHHAFANDMREKIIFIQYISFKGKWKALWCPILWRLSWIFQKEHSSPCCNVRGLLFITITWKLKLSWELKSKLVEVTLCRLLCFAWHNCNL